WSATSRISPNCRCAGASSSRSRTRTPRSSSRASWRSALTSAAPSSSTGRRRLPRSPGCRSVEGGRLKVEGSVSPESGSFNLQPSTFNPERSEEYTMALITGGNREPGAEPRLFVNAGAPTNGASGTGAGECFPGELLVDQTNGNVYVNRGTKASPTWQLLPVLNAQNADGSIAATVSSGQAVPGLM